ncbi:MAG: NUDIX hydrolase [Oxalobacteraceae bacterium]|nr:MAG: NUDIX hydrolase [Oxalobacteraceae bacterium]
MLLVTSRRQGRWVLPKGNIKRGLSSHRSAALEAFEEGGVLGEIVGVPIGHYRQRKVHSNGSAKIVTVQTFAMRVTAEHRTWPEMHIRRRRWMSLAEAIDAVSNAEIRAVLMIFGNDIASRGKLCDGWLDQSVHK